MIQWKFLSTPSARRATRGEETVRPRLPISIHALREEGDSRARRKMLLKANFYPRPPRGGRRGSRWKSTATSVFLSTPSARRATYPCCQSRSWWSSFLSTPSARRATAKKPANLSKIRNFYPRPPRGGRHLTLRKQIDEDKISIHALREEGDWGFINNSDLSMRFLSTPSARRATKGSVVLPGADEISIHALREEGDKMAYNYLKKIAYFYPRPPRGGRRHALRRACGVVDHFYPRPPRGGRHSCRRPRRKSENFYPRPPRGGRPGETNTRAVITKFLSTPSARRATVAFFLLFVRSQISIHALREEGDVQRVINFVQLFEFLSTPSARRATWLFCS